MPIQWDEQQPQRRRGSIRWDEADILVEPKQERVYTPEEQQQIDEFNAGYSGENIVQRGLRTFKDAAGDAMGTLFDVATGGKFSDVVGAEGGLAGRVARHKRAAQSRQRLNQIVADKSIIPGAGLALDAADAAGTMTPAVVGSAAVAPAAAANTAYGILGRVAARDYTNTAQRVWGRNASSI